MGNVTKSETKDFVLREWVGPSKSGRWLPVPCESEQLFDGNGPLSDIPQPWLFLLLHTKTLFASGPIHKWSQGFSKILVFGGLNHVIDKRLE